MNPISDLTRQMTDSAAAIRTLIENVPEAQANWKPDDDTWSLFEVMDHIYNEERVDFRVRLDEILQGVTDPWAESRRVAWDRAANLQTALAKFLADRAASIAYLNSLEGADWDKAVQTEWGQISAGDVLVSWVEHDFLHMRQIIELLHAYNVHQAQPYKVDYAGGW
jgi:hypothetical protein